MRISWGGGGGWTSSWRRCGRCEKTDDVNASIRPFVLECETDDVRDTPFRGVLEVPKHSRRDADGREGEVGKYVHPGDEISAPVHDRDGR